MNIGGQTSQINALPCNTGYGLKYIILKIYMSVEEHEQWPVRKEKSILQVLTMLRTILFTVKNIYSFNNIFNESENFILSSVIWDLKQKCPLYRNILDVSNYLFLKSKKKCR